MNPESRIKLIRSLEEIRVFEKRNYDSRWWKIYAWGGVIFYIAIVLGNIFQGQFNHETFRVVMLIVLLPIPMYSIWFLVRHKVNEKYQLLANAILEIGSIAQENSIPELVPQKNEPKVIKSKKQITKRKKK